jgi:uncharacterized surface protein with fasciclin (FAS1) repeats
LDVSSNNGGIVKTTHNQKGSDLRDSRAVADPCGETRSAYNSADVASPEYSDVKRAAIDAWDRYNELVEVIEENVIEEALRTGSMALSPSKEGPFTCFVPSDRAFQRAAFGKFNGLANNSSNMIDLLKYHTVKGRLSFNDIQGMKNIKTLNGEKLRIDRSGRSRINGLTILQSDIEAENGTIHIIDGVLIPGHFR